MFTGIIEEIGKIVTIKHGSKSIVLEVSAHLVMRGAKVGDSIAVNGVCLTVTRINNYGFCADVMPETLKRSSLGGLSSGSKVNLERALLVTSRLDGHIVSGHIDGTGVIDSFNKDDNAIWVKINTTPGVLRYIVNKGSVAVDGISLTVAEVDDSSFKVSIIPHSQDETTLVKRKIGDVVNIENDMVAKYIEKFSGFAKNEGSSSTQDLSTGLDKTKSSNITMDFLKENGF